VVERLDELLHRVLLLHRETGFNGHVSASSGLVAIFDLLEQEWL